MILARPWERKQNGIFVNIIIKTIDTLINFALLLRIVCLKTFSASYLEQKHFGLANIIFYDNMLVMKTLINDISATLKNKSK